MKRIAVLFLTAFLCFTAATKAHAGDPLLRFGVKAGIISENQHFNSSWSELRQSVEDRKIGFTFGAVLRISPPLLPIFIQPEFVYTRSKVAVDGSLLVGNSQFKVNTFSSPVMVGMSAGLGRIVRLRAYLGPVFNYNTNVKAANDLNDIRAVFEKRSVSWAIGAGIDLLGIMIDARYNGAFSKNKMYLPSGEEIKTSPGTWSLTFGFMF